MFESIQNAYIDNKKDASDINEHLETLVYYSRKCSHVTEFGVRTGVSTSAFLFGLKDGAKLVAYDIKETPEAQHLFNLAKSEGKNAEYIIQDILEPGFEIEPTEFLFIDTKHTYWQLKKELEIHASKVSRYLVFHDTVSFGDHDEVFPGEPIDEYAPHGLKQALDEFLEGNLDWKVTENKLNNNGLLILENVNAYVPQPVYIPKNVSPEDLANMSDTEKINQKMYSEDLVDAFEDVDLDSLPQNV